MRPESAGAGSDGHRRDVTAAAPDPRAARRTGTLYARLASCPQAAAMS